MLRSYDRSLVPHWSGRGKEETYRSRNTAKTKEMHQRVNTFLVVDVVVPEHVGVRNVRYGMSLVRTVDAGELDRISDEEDRQTVEDKILVSFLGEELHGPATNITDSVGSTSLASRGRNTGKEGSLLSLST